MSRWMVISFVMLAACAHAERDYDRMVRNSAGPGYSLFTYEHCGIALQANGTRMFPWAGVAEDAAAQAVEDVVAAIGRPPTLRTAELGTPCHGHANAQVLHLVVSDWNQIGEVLYAATTWVTAEHYRGELDVVVAPSAGIVATSPPADATPTPPWHPPAPCVEQSEAGFAVYTCPSCGTAVVGTGTRTFAWRTAKGYDAPAFDAFRMGAAAPPLGDSLYSSAVSIGCYSRAPVMTVFIDDQRNMSAATAALGLWLATYDYGDEIDVRLMPDHVTNAPRRPERPEPQIK